MEGFNLDPNLLVNALGRDNNDNNGLGGNGLLWIFLLILFWGGNGMGGFGNKGAGAVINDSAIEGQIEAALAKAQAAGCSDQMLLTAINGNKEAIGQLSSYLGVEVNQIENGIRGLERGICDLGYKLGQDTASVMSAITTGNAAMSRQLADCCCATQRSIDSVKYDMATGFCALGTKIDNCCCETKQFIDSKIDAAQAENRAGFQAIRDYMTGEKIAALQTELQSSQFQISQIAQTKQLEDYMKSLMTVSCPK